MKKVLFATTALIATASVAAADVTFGGYGRFGILYSDPDTAGVSSSTNITSRFRLQIDATAESDAGVQFGARARIQQNNSDNQGVGAGPDGIIGNADDVADGGPSGTGINGVRFFAKAGGLEVGVGNIFGALEFMPGQYPIDLGLTGLGYDYTAYNFNADAYSSGGNGAAGSNGVEVIFSAGDFSVHASASDTNDRRALHAAYSFSGFTGAIGLQDSDSANDTELALSISGDLGPANVTLAYADNNDRGEQIVLAGRFDVGASTNIEAYFADRSGATATSGRVNGDSYGIDFNHSLGGGTSIRGGVASLFTGETRADLGVRFNF